MLYIHVHVRTYQEPQFFCRNQLHSNLKYMYIYMYMYIHWTCTCTYVQLLRVINRLTWLHTHTYIHVLWPYPGAPDAWCWGQPGQSWLHWSCEAAAPDELGVCVCVWVCVCTGGEERERGREGRGWRTHVTRTGCTCTCIYQLHLYNRVLYRLFRAVLHHSDYTYMVCTCMYVRRQFWKSHHCIVW